MDKIYNYIMGSLLKSFLSVLLIILGIIICAGVFSCSQINKSLGLQDDNPIEQGIEEVIEEKTGSKIDFTC